MAEMKPVSQEELLNVGGGYMQEILRGAGAAIGGAVGGTSGAYIGAMIGEGVGAAIDWIVSLFA